MNKARNELRSAIEGAFIGSRNTRLLLKMATMKSQIEDLQAILIELDSRKSWVSIAEEISINGENFDRHFTTKSTFELRLISASVRTSGGIMMLMGADYSYELNAGSVYRINREGDQIELFERLAETVVRKTKLVLRSD